MGEGSGEGPPDDPWLAALRRACDRAAAEVRALPAARRAEPCGLGAGGDVTVLVDRVAEDAVLAELEAVGRPLTVVSEEIGVREIAGGGPPIAVVDPIDGSVNAKNGLPLFATSIALADGPTVADVTLGVIRDHGTGEELVAMRGRGAWSDGRRLRAPPPPVDGFLELLLVEGASPARVGALAGALEGHVGRLRALGSLALALCHASAGRAQGMLGLGPARSVDIAAAQLVAREAGLLVRLPEIAELGSAPLDTTTRYRVAAAPDEATLKLLLAPLGR